RSCGRPRWTRRCVCSGRSPSTTRPRRMSCSASSWARMWRRAAASSPATPRTCGSWTCSTRYGAAGSCGAGTRGAPVRGVGPGRPRGEGAAQGGKHRVGGMADEWKTASIGRGDFANPPSDRWLEDYVAGEMYEYGSITLTESDIQDFAVRYDPQSIHVDEDSAR